jgi:ATP-dependent helicase HrpA
LKAMTGVHIPESAWQEGGLPPHLRMQVKVVNRDGKALDVSRDINQLKQAYATQEGASHRQLQAPEFERRDLKKWEVGNLPPSLTVEQGGIALRGYPALVDEGDSVAVRLIDAEANAVQLHRGGVRRLIMLGLAKEMRYLRKNLPHLDRMRLYYAKVPATTDERQIKAAANLEEALVSLIVDRCFLEGRPDIREESVFKERLERHRGELMSQANQVCDQLMSILDRYHQVRKALSAITQKNWLDSVRDMQAQLDRLIYQGFMTEVAESNLHDYPRYLDGLLKRIEKLPHAAGRDRQRMGEMAELLQQWSSWEAQCREEGRLDARVDEIHWQLEELRISLFAQEIGTAFPVSVKRISKRWKELGL